MIHELLSCDGWINPQIDYLLWIQNIRMHSSGIFDTCFLHITSLGELFIPTMIMSIIYWCVSFESGLYLFTLNSVGLLFAYLFKMIACVYRPWVLSDKIKPLDAAFKMAGGYSFPSGHSVMASTTWGGMAYLLRKRNVWCTLIILLILLIGFSRTYVGVHTPQDVIVGLSIGLFLVFIIDYLLKYCERNKTGYFYFMGIFNAAVILSMIYIFSKQYPLDYVNGQLLVNPKQAIYTTIIYTAWIMGIMNGAFLCKIFFPFKAETGSLRSKIIRGSIGFLVLSVLFIAIYTYFFSGETNYVLMFVMMFLSGFFITGGYPFIFSKISGLYK